MRVSLHLELLDEESWAIPSRGLRVYPTMIVAVEGVDRERLSRILLGDRSLLGEGSGPSRRSHTVNLRPGSETLRAVARAFRPRHASRFRKIDMIDSAPGYQHLKLTKLDFRNDMEWRDLRDRFSRVWVWIAAAARLDAAYGILRAVVPDHRYIGGSW